MKFDDIPQLISGGSYEINIPIDYLVGNIEKWIADKAYYGLVLCPDFQRGHVWTPAQQTAFLEYFLQGGRSGMVIYFNKPSWNHKRRVIDGYDDFVVVDGLQRLSALMGFMRDKVRAFGLLKSEFEGKLWNTSLKFNINDLQTREQVLTWYLQMNAGGTPHTAEEIERVRQLLQAEKAAPAPTPSERGSSQPAS